jgi:hypothetical protein
MNKTIHQEFSKFLMNFKSCILRFQVERLKSGAIGHIFKLLTKNSEF